MRAGNFRGFRGQPWNRENFLPQINHFSHLPMLKVCQGRQDPRKYPAANLRLGLDPRNFLAAKISRITVFHIYHAVPQSSCHSIMKFAIRMEAVGREIRRIPFTVRLKYQSSTSPNHPYTTYANNTTTYPVVLTVRGGSISVMKGCSTTVKSSLVSYLPLSASSFSF